MKAIEVKYNSIRPLLRNGDVILFQGSGWLARTIQFFTKGRFNHVGVVWIAMNRVFIIDSNAPGVHPEFLSARIRIYKDFEIVRFRRPLPMINNGLCFIMDKAMEGTGIKYNFLRLLRIAINDSFNVDPKWLDQQGHDICSQFAQIFCRQLNIKCLQDIPLITPMDFDEKLDWNEGEILFR